MLVKLFPKCVLICGYEYIISEYKLKGHPREKWSLIENY